MVVINEDELKRRHQAAVVCVAAMLALAALLIALAFAGVRPNLPSNFVSPTLYGVLWVTILVFGLGAVALRRTRFNALRLQDIANLHGVSGLLATLQQTTMLVALIGGVIAVLGYLLTLMSNDAADMRNAGIVAVAVLLYCYPRRGGWERTAQASQQPGGLAGPPPAKGTTA